MKALVESSNLKSSCCHRVAKLIFTQVDCAPTLRKAAAVGYGTLRRVRARPYARIYPQ